ncbi:hypothetical protein ACFSR7_35860 [Cohnella sp. GCM10020058]|uniref:hypothetical protein n=1 Tax=Cohnella sp. GCM10020058 TaxID=3317330 RepID=UPI003632DC3E
MTMLRPVYVYRPTDEQLAAQAAGELKVADMNLGEPIRIEDPQSLINKITDGPYANLPKPKPKPEGESSPKNYSNRGKVNPDKLTKEKYLELRKEERLSRDQICERFNITRSTLITYLGRWGIRSKKRDKDPV